MTAGPERITYTVNETAAALGVSEHHVRNLIETGEIPVMRLGRRILIPRRVLDQMVEERLASAGGE